VKKTKSPRRTRAFLENELRLERESNRLLQGSREIVLKNLREAEAQLSKERAENRQAHNDLADATSRISGLKHLLAIAAGALGMHDARLAKELRDASAPAVGLLGYSGQTLNPSRPRVAG
jgi:hypothetical protein